MIWHGAGQILQGVVTIGVLVGFINTLNRIFIPIREFTQQISVFQRGFSSLENIYLFFKDPRGERTCSTDPVFVNGEIIPAREVPCEAASIDSRKHDVKPQEIGPDGR